MRLFEVTVRTNGRNSDSIVSIGRENRTPIQLSLQTPSESNAPPHPPVSLSRDETAAIVEVDQFCDLADETVFIPIAVSRWPESSRRLVVESTVELVETDSPDHTHLLDGRLEFEFTAETEAGEQPSEAPT